MAEGLYLMKGWDANIEPWTDEETREAWRDGRMGWARSFNGWTGGWDRYPRCCYENEVVGWIINDKTHETVHVVRKREPQLSTTKCPIR